MTADPLPQAQFDWLPAAPFRVLFCRLVEDAGLPWRAVAVALELPPLTAARLVHPRRRNDRIRRVDACRVMAASAAELARRGQAATSADRSCTIVRHWLREGSTVADIARASGVPRGVVTRLAWGRLEECPQRTAWLLRAAREEWLARPMASVASMEEPQEAA